MKLKIIYILILGIFLNFYVVFPYTNISSCQTINSAGEYRLNQSIVINGSNCIDITQNNVNFNCQNYNISGNLTSNTFGISTDNLFNITLSNCNIYDFDEGIRLRTTYDSSASNIHIENPMTTGFHWGSGASRNSAINITIVSSANYGIFIGGDNNTLNIFSVSDSSNTGVYVDGSNNILSNGFVDNSSVENIHLLFNNNTLTSTTSINAGEHGLVLSGTGYHTITNCVISDSSWHGMRINSPYNTVTSSIVQNNSWRAMEFTSQNNTIHGNTLRSNTGGTLNLNEVGNLFYQNYLGTNSSIAGTSISGNYFNNSQYGNYWDDFNSSIHPPYCIGVVCDYLASGGPNSGGSQSSSIKTIFPSFGLFSLFGSLLLIMIYLLI